VQHLDGDTPATALDALSQKLANEVKTKERKKLAVEGSCRALLQKFERPNLTMSERADLRGVKNEMEDKVQNASSDFDAARGAKERLTKILGAFNEGTLPSCPCCVGGEASVATKCGHAFCSFHMEDECVKKGTCAVCQAPVLAGETESLVLIGGRAASRYGAKVVAVLAKIRQLLAAGEKRILVYAQFDPLQKVFARALRETGIKHLVLSGNPAQITTTLRDFNDPEKEHNVLLLSLARKAAGINLTCSSQVLFLHPFLDIDENRAKAWEAQAIGRVARAGQTKQVHVWRFLARATVEDELRAHFLASSWKAYFSKFRDTSGSDNEKKGLVSEGKLEPVFKVKQEPSSD
jgi:SNF2 family DNA or RNA helicase